MDTLGLFLIVVKENNTKKTKDEFKTNFIEEIQFLYFYIVKSARNIISASIIIAN